MVWLPVFVCVQTMVWLPVFVCVQTMVWLPVVGIVNLCSDVDARDCTRELYELELENFILQELWIRFSQKPV